MKETKVYVDEMPNSCSKCEWCTLNHKDNYGRSFCLISRMPLYNGDKVKKERGQNKDSLSDFDCPLQSIKTHDKEILEEQREKTFILYSLLYQELEKQDIENVASRIDYMTSENYADICELYKTAKNLKQHDRELVREVCEKIKNIANERTSIDTGMLDMVYFDDVVEKIQKEFEK